MRQFDVPRFLNEIKFFAANTCHGQKYRFRKPLLDSNLMSPLSFSNYYNFLCISTYLLMALLKSSTSFFSVFTYFLFLGKFQANLFKKAEPTKEEYTILSLELLYLWNAISQCEKDALKKMLIGMLK